MKNQEVIPNEERDAVMLEAYKKARDLLNYCKKELPSCHSKRLALKKLDQFIRAMIPMEDATWQRHKPAQVPSEPSSLISTESSGVDNG